jgi:hypothetical protein
VLNPEMDEAYYWTGGHEADDSDLVHTYHLATNRWSIGYVADFFRGGMGATKGMSFSGRPDCANHTYINYAWDPVTRRMINSSTGGTCVFNPERGDYDLRSVSPFGHDNYTAKAVSTPRGVVFWTPSYFGLFDAKTGKHERLAVKGRLPAPDHDGTSVCYDPKRDVIWMVTWAPTLGQAWRYDMKTGLVEGMNPAGQKAFVAAKVFDGFRETAYLPKPDLVLFNNFAGPSARQVAYDPEKNRWVTLAISRGKNSSNALGHVAVGYVYDARRDLVWGIGNRNLNFVLKVDPATLDISEDPAR